MAAEVALYNLMSNDGPIAALVGDRIAPTKRAPGDPLPALTFHQIAGQPQHGLSGPIGYVEAAYQINCWAADNLQASALAQAVIDKLDGFNNQTIAGLDVDHIKAEIGGDIPVLAAGLDESELNGKRIDMEIHYRE
jgi:hypothetical protein